MGENMPKTNKATTLGSLEENWAIIVGLLLAKNVEVHCNKFLSKQTTPIGDPLPYFSDHL
jgi:hypothetical protein